MELRTHANRRTVAALPFCYLCGRSFGPAEPRTRDHVPPKAIFLARDRDGPLILPVHSGCNQRESVNDEIIGQLIGILHGRLLKDDQRRFEVEVIHTAPGTSALLGLKGVPMQQAIGRWIRAFHSALYHEYLPRETPNAIHPPFPSGQQKDGTWIRDDLRIQHPLIVEVIKRNRIADRLDRIECYNGKCVYECVWERMDNQTWGCFFALKIYDWKALADSTNFPSRGCVGWYQARTGRPHLAAVGIVKVISFPLENRDPLDPFGP